MRTFGIQCSSDFNWNKFNKTGPKLFFLNKNRPVSCNLLEKFWSGFNEFISASHHTVYQIIDYVLKRLIYTCMNVKKYQIRVKLHDFL